MAAKWSVATATTPITPKGPSVVHLPDGVPFVAIAENPPGSANSVAEGVQINLARSAATITQLVSLASSDVTAAVAADAAGNAYIAMGTGPTPGLRVAVYPISGGAPIITTIATTGMPGSEFPYWTDVVWCNTGGGTGGAGHLLVVWSADGINGYTILDAGALLIGTSTTTASGQSPTFLGTTTVATSVWLAPSSSGGTSGVSLSAGSSSTIGTLNYGTWAVNSSGVLSTNTLVTTVTGTSGDVLGLVRTGSNAYFGAWLTTSGVIACGVGTTSAFTSESGPGVVAGLPGVWPISDFGSNSTLSPVVFADPVTSGQAWLAYPDVTSGVLSRLVAAVSTSGPSVTWGTASSPIDGGLVATTNLGMVRQPLSSRVDAVVADTSGNLYGTYADLGPVPAAPTPVSPAYSTVTPLASGETFSWTPDPTKTQYGYLLSFQQINGTLAYWNATSGALQSLPVINVSSSTSVAIPSSILANGGAQYQWTVSTCTSDLVLSPAPYPWLVTGAAAPSVSVTDAATGTGNPTVSWTFTAGTTSSVQSTYEVLVGPSGWNPATTSPTWSSGTIVASTTGPVTVGASLEAGVLAQGTWDAYVVVVDSVGATNAFNNKATFTVSYTAPGTPTLTAAYQSATNAVLLTATSVTNGNTVLFEYSLNAGTTWATVRNGAAVTVSSSTATLTDYDICGSGSSIEYRATQVASGPKISSTSSVQTVAISWTGLCWLKDPLTPGDNYQFIIDPPIPTKQTEVSSVFTPAGAPYEVVVSDGVKGTDPSPLHVHTYDTADATALAALITPARTLLFQSAYGHNLYVWPQGVRTGALLPSAASSPNQTTDVTMVNVARP